MKVESVRDAWSAPFVELPAATNSGNSRHTFFTVKSFGKEVLRVQQCESFRSTKPAFLHVTRETGNVGLT